MKTNFICLPSKNLAFIIIALYGVSIGVFCYHVFTIYPLSSTAISVVFSFYAYYLISRHAFHMNTDGVLILHYYQTTPPSWLVQNHRHDLHETYQCVQAKNIFPSLLMCEFLSTEAQHNHVIFIARDMLSKHDFHYLCLLAKMSVRDCYSQRAK